MKHNLTAALGTTFVAFEPGLVAAENEEELLQTQLEECNAAIEFLDISLDEIVDMVVSVVGNRRGSGLYRELFGNKQVFEFKRPILNEQLDAMESWPQILADHDHPVLVSAVQKLGQVLPLAKEAQTNKKAVKARLVTFRETGTRAELITEFNGLRKSCFGKLSKLQHEHNLPTGWAESFFRQNSGSRKLTLLEVERRIAANAEEGAYLEALYQQLTAEQAAAEEAARQAEERARQAEIASKRELLARLQAELAELEGES